MEHEHDFSQGGNEGKIGDDHANEVDSGSEEDAGAYFEARFEQPSLGIVLSSTEDGSTRPLDVLRTVEGGAGEAAGILPGSRVVHVNGTDVLGLPQAEVFALIRESPRPVTIGMQRPSDAAAATTNSGTSVASSVTSASASASASASGLTDNAHRSENTAEPEALSEAAGGLHDSGASHNADSSNESVVPVWAMLASLPCLLPLLGLHLSMSGTSQLEWRDGNTVGPTNALRSLGILLSFYACALVAALCVFERGAHRAAVSCTFGLMVVLRGLPVICGLQVTLWPPDVEWVDVPYRHTLKFAIAIAFYALLRFATMDEGGHRGRPRRHVGRRVLAEVVVLGVVAGVIVCTCFANGGDGVIGIRAKAHPAGGGMPEMAVASGLEPAALRAHADAQQRFRAAARGSDGVIRCADGSHSLEAGQINDDYCDCEDGSDEAKTSACAHISFARFQCTNKGFAEEWLPASRVGDGVCDCCDGSDETDVADVAPFITCEDRCEEMQARDRGEARSALDRAVAGRRERSRAVLASREQAVLWERKQRGAKRDIDKLREMLKYIEYYKLKEEQAENNARLAAARAILTRARKLKFERSARGYSTTHDDNNSTEQAGGREHSTIVVQAERSGTCDEGGDNLEGEACILRYPVELSPQVGDGDENALASALDASVPPPAPTQFKVYMNERRSKRAVKAAPAPKPRKLSRTEERRKGPIRSIFNGKTLADRRMAFERLVEAIGLLFSPLRLSCDIATWALGYVTATCQWTMGWISWLVPRRALLMWQGFVEQDIENGRNNQTNASAAPINARTDSDVSADARDRDSETVGNWIVAALPRAMRSRVRRFLRGLPGTSSINALLHYGRIMWDAPYEYYAWHFPEVNASWTRPEARSLRRLLALARREVSAAEKRVVDFTTKLNEDFGAERAFHSLAGKCYELRAGGYLYKACPFSNLKQDNTLLGRFKSWTHSDRSWQNYVNGGNCFATGKPRVGTLRFECGVKTELVSVSEHATCEYDFVLRTPAQCTDAHVDAKHAAARKLGLDADALLAGIAMDDPERGAASPRQQSRDEL